MTQNVSSIRSNWIQILVLFGAVLALMMFVMSNTGNSGDDLPSVNFDEPSDGATVPTTFTVIMQAENLTVEPAGEINENAGHFHILIDADFVAEGEVVPSDEQHLHFGDGSTEAELTLEPGTYTLRLQFANGAHEALVGEGNQYLDEITVTVSEDGESD